MNLTTQYQMIGSANLSGNQVVLRLYAKYNSQSIANNNSSVSAYITIYCAPYAYVHCYTHSVNFTGQFTDSQNVGSYYHGWESNTETTILGPVTYTVAHDANGTKTFNLGGYFTCSAGISGTISNVSCTLPAIPRDFTKKPTLTVAKGNSETSLNCSWTTSETCDYVQYKIGSGNWIDAATSISATSGSFTISSGLTANTNYSITIQCRRKDSQRQMASDAVEQKTHPYPSITAITPGASTTWDMSGVASKTVGATLNNPLNRSVTVYISLGTGTGGAKIVTFSATTGTSVSTSLSKTTINNAITNAQQSGLTYWLTYNNNTSSMSNTYNLIQSDCAPTLGALTYKDNSWGSVTGDISYLLQNKSVLMAKIASVTTKYNAGVSSLTIAIGPITKNATANTDINMGTFNYGTGNQTMTATVKDTRGWSASVTTQVKFLSYSEPSLTATWTRNGGYGTNTTLAIKASYSSITVGGTQKNAWLNNSTAYVQYSKDGGARSNISNAQSINTSVSITGVTNNQTHTLIVYANDKISNKSLTINLGKGVPLMSIIENPTAVGVNVEPSTMTEAGFYVGGKANITENANITGTNNGALQSALTTGSHLAGNRGRAIINSTASGTEYNMLAKMNSTNGVWTMGSYGKNFKLFYTAKSIIDAGTNSITKDFTLASEDGNMSVPGTITAGNLTTGGTLTVGGTNVISAINGKAPTSHASSATTYGVGTTANYGHCKTINNLTTASYADGNALSAYQGKLLMDKINSLLTALQNTPTFEVIYNNNSGLTIPSKSSGSYTNITLTKSVSNFDYILVVRASGTVIFDPASDWSNSISYSSSYGTEGLNIMGCRFDGSSATSTTIKIGGNYYAGIYTTGGSHFDATYTGNPLKRLVGIKLRPSVTI